MSTKILGLVLCLAVMALTACSATKPPRTDADMALIKAAERGQTDQIYRLLQNGANVNAKDKDGWTPYLAASTMGQLEAMRVLRAFGAKTEAEVEVENIAHQYLSN